MQSSLGIPTRIHGSTDATQPRHQQRRAAWPVVIWTLAALVLLAQLRAVHPGTEAVFGSLEVDLPGLTEMGLAASAFLRETSGLLIAAGALLVTLVPYVFGARGRTAAMVYLFMAIVAVLAIAGTWLAVHRPLDVLRYKLEIPAGPIGR